MSTKRFLSKREVRDRVKISYAEIARREKKGKFPQRVRLGGYPNSRAVWVEAEIDAWIDQQIAVGRVASPSKEQGLVSTAKLLLPYNAITP